MPLSNGEVDGNGEEGVDIVDIVGANVIYLLCTIVGIVTQNRQMSFNFQ